MRAAAVRFAALGACAMLPMIAQAAQIHASAVKPPAKDAPVLLQADEIDYDSDRKIVSAVGHVEIVQEGHTLEAERVDYDQNTDTVTARGHVVMIDERGNVAFSDHVVLKDHMRDGVLSGFGALIGKNGRLAARNAQRINGTTVVARRSNYSPCKICNKPGQRTPLWQVKSERVVYDQVKHKIRFQSAIIDVEGVPVAWVPTFTVSDPTVRYASGLLTPEVGTSTKIGYFTRLPCLHLHLFQPGPDGGADGLHLRRRGAGAGIPPALEQWRHVVSGQRRLQSRRRTGRHAGRADLWPHLRLGPAATGRHLARRL